MPTTYLDLTNRLLRRLNEVPIAQADFDSARGVHAMAKDAIVASVHEINHQDFEWPFNAQTHTQIMTVGQTEYDFPANLKIPKWDSFYVAKNSETTITRVLKFVSRDYWVEYLKTDDLNAVPDGLDVPVVVFEKHGFGFGVSPLPNRPYAIKFDYFLTSPDLTIHNDTSTIPSQYDEAIIQGGLYHFYMFRDNSEQAQLAEAKFKKMVNEMRTILINKDDHFRSTMVNRRRMYGAPTGVVG